MTNYILIDNYPKNIYILIDTVCSTYTNFLGSGKMFLPENNREMTCLTVLGCYLENDPKNSFCCLAHMENL